MFESLLSPVSRAWRWVQDATGLSAGGLTALALGAVALATIAFWLPSLALAVGLGALVSAAVVGVEALMKGRWPDPGRVLVGLVLGGFFGLVGAALVPVAVATRGGLATVGAIAGGAAAPTETPKLPARRLGREPRPAPAKSGEGDAIVPAGTSPGATSPDRLLTDGQESAPLPLATGIIRALGDK